MVVMSPSSSMPWNPATTGTIPASMVSLQALRFDRGDARTPVNVGGANTDLAAGERARGDSALAQRHGQQRDRHLLARGEQHVHLARIRFARDAGREIHQPIGGVPMAETTTAMRSPRSRTAATFSATRWMSSTEPTDVPPYFWTIVFVRGLAFMRRAWCARTLQRSQSAAPSAAGLLPPACAKSGRPPPLPPT